MVNLNDFHNVSTNEKGAGSRIALTTSTLEGPATGSSNVAWGRTTGIEVAEGLKRNSGANCWENLKKELQPF